MSQEKNNRIVRRAAAEYFRAEASQDWQHDARLRRAIDAVHKVYARIPEDTERNFLEALYTDTNAEFGMSVSAAAYSCRIKCIDAWEIAKRFTANVERELLD